MINILDYRDQEEVVRLLAQCMYPDQARIAETDRDTVDFYIKMGFEVISLGEKYVGVERFRCMLEIY